ncbi:MAG: hypothetical protein K0S08_439 [Gammaproteobacteria bacterium]|jgi:hypothetical protein|nr:hypothetical protein [Gammaproteobacteria bacterium]
MIKKSTICIALCLTTFPLFTFAESAESSADSNLLKSGFFVGLGGGYNSVNFDQTLDLTGTSNVYSGPTLVSYGEATGPADPFNTTQNTFAPNVQLGYYKFLTNSNTLWGVKFIYQHLDATVTDPNLVVPQFGTLTNVSGSDTFTGHATIGSTQTSINHELALMPLIGHGFKNSYIYFGAGPALFETKTNIYDVTGYADVNGVHYDISGTPQNFSSSKWMWGGAAQIGMSYYIDPTWFLDMDYTYTITKHYTTNYTSSYASAFSTYTDTGMLYGSANQRIISQGVTLSINKAFVM